MVEPYETPLAAVALTGWAKVGNVWICVEPLRDTAADGYAHLSYRCALAAAESLGARLPSVDDIVAMHAAARDAGFELAPVTLPDVTMLRKAGIPIGNEVAINAFRSANMMGLAWARLHDERALLQLEERGWDGASPVANAGKHWVAGAPAGRAYLFGWWNGTRFVQPPPAVGSHGFHDDTYHDYGTTVVVVRDEEP